jgi:L-threonylcarbamoyladenylate synthase
MSKEIFRAIKVLKQGGIILYPTEGVWGLGCDPFNETVVLRLLKIKKRSILKGLILIAANWQQVKDLIKVNLATCEVIRSKNKLPITWVFPATRKVPRWITGKFNSVAIRVTMHPIARNICQKFGAPIVSTSANLSGNKSAKSLKQIANSIITQVDFVLQGSVGTLDKPTPICDIKTGKTIRN